METKKGSTAITVAIVLTVGICAVTLFVAFLIDSITPLILQQKLQAIATKYMYVIEKYGYFTSSEKEQLINELKEKGFDTNRITLTYPQLNKPYGELIEFEITYKYKSIPLFGMEDKLIKVSKTSYSKI